MSDQTQSPPPKSITSAWPPLALLALAIVTFSVAQTYNATAARFPSIVAVILGILAVFDLWSRTRLPGAAIVSGFWGAGFGRREMNYDPTFAAQAGAVGWILIGFLGMALAGILAAMPIYTAAYVKFRGQRTWAAALISGAVVFAFQYGVFEWLLDYKLYRGIFFTKGGLAAW